jgi:four helix bundle protein
MPTTPSFWSWRSRAFTPALKLSTLKVKSSKLEVRSSKFKVESSKLYLAEGRAMDNREFSRQLEKRTRDFAVKIIRLSGKLPNNSEGWVIRNQVTKAGTSIGANYREANRARSKADFINKIKICESEASETQYWLQVIAEADFLPWESINPEFNEASELLAIFTSIRKSCKSESPKQL